MTSLYVSHGSPMTILQQDGAAQFLRSLSGRVDRPTAILVVSAHWETDQPMVSAAAQPQTIHDFGGFPASLYQLSYPAPGAPDLARRVAALTGAGLDDRRGLDHGAWMPLLMAWPQADIGVTQLSIQSHLGPDHHYALGQRLAPLLADGVMILASGAMTHNLRAYFSDDPQHTAQSLAFSDWMEQAITQGRIADLLAYRDRAPFARQAHPRDEHLLPLFVALGAGQGQGVGRALYRGQDGSLSMDSYQWG